MAFIWLNGKFLDEGDAHLSLRDTGLLHAAGLFTTMRAADRRVYRLDAHLKRLRDSAQSLFVPINFTDEVLTQAIEGLLERNELTDARLRLTATRGVATPDPLHGLLLAPTLFLTAAPLEPYPDEMYQRGFTVIALDEQKLNPFDLQAGHKTLNYFSRLAGLRTANQRGAGEAIWFDVNNYAVSGSISNLFLVKNGVLRTPPTPTDLRDAAIAARTPYSKSAVLPGITRQAILDLATSAAIKVEIGPITIDDLLEADEAFLTNSIMHIMPVCRVERKAIANEQPGSLTKRLMTLLRDDMAR